MSILNKTDEWLLENDFLSTPDDYTDALDTIFNEIYEPIIDYYFDELDHLSFEGFAEEFGYQQE